MGDAAAYDESPGQPHSAAPGQLPAPAERGIPIETETTLAIVADAPDEVADAVAALTGLAGYDLARAPDENIHDRYFDTPDGSLGLAGRGLRIRDVAGRRLLTIKGPSSSREPGVRSRTEQEQEWPDRAWALLRAELGDALGVPPQPSAPDPADALEAVGLVLVQERKTLRRVRAVLPRSGVRTQVVELAIDAVTYSLGGRAVRHHELELELETDDGEAAAAALAEGLIARFAPSLRRWSLGKTATGTAIAGLIDEQGADAVLTEDGTVRPWFYDAIG